MAVVGAVSRLKNLYVITLGESKLSGRFQPDPAIISDKVNMAGRTLGPPKVFVRSRLEELSSTAINPK